MSVLGWLVPPGFAAAIFLLMDAARYVAVPGTSEHQAGLAVDLRSPSGRGTGFDRT